MQNCLFACQSKLSKFNPLGFITRAIKQSHKETSHDILLTLKLCPKNLNVTPCFAKNLID